MTETEYLSDELRHLKDFLSGLQSRETTMHCGGQDVTAREVTMLKREISFLEKVIADLKLSVASNA